MKILLYTVSDFAPGTMECIDLLLKSLGDQKYDFCIVSNKTQNSKYKVYYDIAYPEKYIGGIKYHTKLLPKNYDYYIYFDSDILYFGKLVDLLPANKNQLSVVEENPNKIYQSDWWHYAHQYYVDFNDTNYFMNSQALNAGTFIYDRYTLNTISRIYKLFLDTCSKVRKNEGRLEQSIYNYFIHQELKNHNIPVYKNLSALTQLHAHNYIYDESKTLYHFCGFFGEMSIKYQNMKKLYDQYIQQK